MSLTLSTSSPTYLLLKSTNLQATRLTCTSSLMQNSVFVSLVQSPSLCVSKLKLILIDFKYLASLSLQCGLTLIIPVLKANGAVRICSDLKVTVNSYTDMQRYLFLIKKSSVVRSPVKSSSLKSTSQTRIFRLNSTINLASIQFSQSTNDFSALPAFDLALIELQLYSKPQLTLFFKRLLE